MSTIKEELLRLGSCTMREFRNRGDDISVIETLTEAYRRLKTDEEIMEIERFAIESGLEEKLGHNGYSYLFKDMRERYRKMVEKNKTQNQIITSVAPECFRSTPMFLKYLFNDLLYNSDED